jgi:hypothetical protein
MHTSTHRLLGPLALIVAALAVAPAGPARAQTNGVGERFSAIAVDLDRGTQTRPEMVIQRWSSNAEQQRLMSVLMTQGADKLLDALTGTPKVGYIQTPGSLAWDLHFAQRTPGADGGERVIVATDRPLSFSEVWNQSRTVDYPFTVIELRVNDSGEGDGTLSFATRVIPDPENNIVTLENYDTQRIRLTQVTREKAGDQ